MLQLKFVACQPTNPVTQPKISKVHDLGTWMEAFTIFTHTVLQVAPHRALELLGYQAFIIEADHQMAGWSVTPISVVLQQQTQANAGTPLRPPCGS